MRAHTLERYTKAIMIASAAAAGWMQIWLLRERWPLFGAVVIACFAAGWAIGRWQSPIARRVVLFVAWVVPVMFVYRYGGFEDAEWIVWIATIWGVMVATGRPLQWAMPDRWKLPLAYWGLVTACSWPVVMLRESDFDMTLVPSVFGAVSSQTALLVVTGIFWLDWLFKTYSDRRDGFEADIVLPLGLGWTAVGVLGVYQMLGHLHVLNPGIWAGLQRADGGLGDANALGVTSALWGPALAAAAFDHPGRKRSWVIALGLPLSWLAVWASGSRSSVPVVIFGLAGLIVALWRSSMSLRLKGTTAAAVVLALAAAFWIEHGSSSAVGPVTRLARTDLIPRSSAAWLESAKSKLWIRDGYGVIANDVTRRSPLVGVGEGAFAPLVHLYSWKLFRRILPPDNAQNWFRHQLAELGVLGSLGSFVWSISLIMLLFGRREPHPRPSGIVVRLLLIAFGLISLVGVPGQSLLVAITFWTFSFWFLVHIEWHPEGPSWLASRLAWPMMWTLALAFVVITTGAALTFLRPPLQALRAGVPYEAGFHGREGDSTFQWTMKRGVAVIPADKPFMELTVLVNYPEITEHPLQAKVWVNGALAVDARLTSTGPITKYISTQGRDHILIETWVDHVEHPSYFGATDTRDLGLLVRWAFVDGPPPVASSPQ